MGLIFILECDGSVGCRRHRLWGIGRRRVWALENLGSCPPFPVLPQTCCEAHYPSELNFLIWKTKRPQLHDCQRLFLLWQSLFQRMRLHHQPELLPPGANEDSTIELSRSLWIYMCSGFYHPSHAPVAISDENGSYLCTRSGLRARIEYLGQREDEEEKSPDLEDGWDLGSHLLCLSLNEGLAQLPSSQERLSYLPC